MKKIEHNIESCIPKILYSHENVLMAEEYTDYILSEQNLKYEHQYFYSFKEWCNLVKQTVLKLIATHRLYLKPLSTNQIFSLNLDNKIYKSLSDTAKYLPEISNAYFFVLGKQ